MFDKYTLVVVGMDVLAYVESHTLANVKSEISEAVKKGNPVLFLEENFESTRTELTELVPNFGLSNVVKYDGELRQEKGQIVGDDGADAVIERSSLNPTEEFRVCGIHAQREVRNLILGLCGRHNRQVLVIRAACAVHWDFFSGIPNLTTGCTAERFEFVSNTCVEKMRRVVARHPEDFEDGYPQPGDPPAES